MLSLTSLRRRARHLCASILAVGLALGGLDFPHASAQSSENADTRSDSSTSEGDEDAPDVSTLDDEDAVPEDAEDVPVLSREQAIERAVEHNHDLEISRREAEIAERNVSLGNAGWLPTLEANASQNRTFGGPGLFGSGNIFGVQLDWLAFGGLGRVARYDRLEAERDVRKMETRAEIESTLVDVTTAYWRIVRERELLAAIRETLELSRERLDIARTRSEAGTGSQVDVNLARVELNRDRSSLAEQRIALAEAKHELNRVLGHPPEEGFRVDGSIEVADDLALEQLRQLAREENRRIRTARRERRSATRRVEELKADKWPELNLGLGYNYTEFHGDFLPPLETVPTFEYTLGLTIPLFDGFNVLRRVDNAQTERTIADVSIREERTRVRTEIESAWTAYERHRERMKLARESIDVSRENVQIALTQFEAGTITQLELRQVQVNLLDARTRLIEARFAAKRAELELKQLAGQLYDELL